MENEDKAEKAVEVILPDEQITEVELSDNEPHIKESEPKIKVQEEKEPEVEQPRAAVVDEREKALADLRKQYEHQIF
jgi:hypothetical protein